MNIHDFKSMKAVGTKISMVTCYDYWSAKILAQSDIDCLLVGDSLSMVMHGYSTTIPATIDMMQLHVAAVAKGAGDKFVIGDLPFLSYRKGITPTLIVVEKIMQAGAQAIKLEGAIGNQELIRHIVESGVPVMGHIGLTPQAIHQLGGFRVQGRQEEAARALIEQAVMLEQSGCFAVVLECVPNLLAALISARLSIPTIGIGAGQDVDGQVLVLQDLLGMNAEFKPKFVKNYLDGFDQIKKAVNCFNSEIKAKQYPLPEHCYS